MEVYLLMLYVSLEQENAIRELFLHHGWLYNRKGIIFEGQRSTSGLCDDGHYKAGVDSHLYDATCRVTNTITTPKESLNLDSTSQINSFSTPSPLHQDRSRDIFSSYRSSIEVLLSNNEDSFLQSKDDGYFSNTVRKENVDLHCLSEKSGTSDHQGTAYQKNDPKRHEIHDLRKDSYEEEAHCPEKIVSHLSHRNCPGSQRHVNDITVPSFTADDNGKGDNSVSSNSHGNTDLYEDVSFSTAGGRLGEIREETQGTTVDTCSTNSEKQAFGESSTCDIKKDSVESNSDQSPKLKLKNSKRIQKDHKSKISVKTDKNYHIGQNNRKEKSKCEYKDSMARNYDNRIDMEMIGTSEMWNHKNLKEATKQSDNQTSGKRGKFYCSECKVTFSYLNHFKGHQIDGKCTFECSYCKKVYTSSTYSKFKAHLRYHRNERQFKCDLCNKSYNEFSKLKMHKRNHSGERPFICEICGAQFTVSSNLKQHKKIMHTEQTRIYQCDLCGVSFKREANLRYHTKYMHTTARPFVCSICNKSFKTKYVHNLHMNTHREDICFKCDICGKGFKNKSYLFSHMKRHNKEFSIFCEICGKGFYENRKLQDHLRTHSGEKPYKCKLCDYRCAIQGNLKKHNKIHIRENKEMNIASEINLVL
ncbi:hypothetical protein ACJMK2_006803 [Sinanodonta woodiana]|uniref:C2H2-type domain-containing protein n=1 Tax=Sinanodonta woodiana TaxID=1069815 RepID=A0ABD3VUA8_SINWO